MKELMQIMSDYDQACDESQMYRLDQRENELVDDVHTIEEEVQLISYLLTLAMVYRKSSSKKGLSNTNVSKKKRGIYL